MTSDPELDDAIRAAEVTVETLTDEMVRAYRDSLSPVTQYHNDCEVALRRGPTAQIARDRIVRQLNDRLRAAVNDDAVSHQHDGRFAINARLRRNTP